MVWWLIAAFTVGVFVGLLIGRVLCVKAQNDEIGRAFGWRL